MNWFTNFLFCLFGHAYGEPRRFLDMRCQWWDERTCCRCGHKDFEHAGSEGLAGVFFEKELGL